MILEGVDGKIKACGEVIKIIDKKGKEKEVPIKDITVLDLRKAQKEGENGFIVLSYPNAGFLGKTIRFNEEHQGEFESFEKSLIKEEIQRLKEKADEVKKDEQILLTAHGKIDDEYGEFYLTATDVMKATFEKKKKNSTHMELTTKRIPRNDIYEIKISVLNEQLYLMEIKFKENNKNHVRGVIFESEKLEEFEQIFSEVDNENYKIYLVEKPKLVEKYKEGIKNYCWYKDDALMSHIESYESTKQASSSANEAAKYGWITSGTSTTEGHVNIGRTFAGMMMFGELALLAGGSRTDGKVTVSYVRSPEWLASRNKTAAPVQAADDPLQKMKQLKEMLDAGLINESEYNSKKADLLAKM